MLKIQTYGLTKNGILKLYQDVIECELRSANNVTETQIDKFSEFAEYSSRVLLFGVQEMEQINYSYKNDVLTAFDSDYDGLNEYLEKNAHARSYEELSTFVIDKLENMANFIRAELSDIETPQEEKDFLAIVAVFEKLLEKIYSQTFLPELEKIENEIKTEIEKIYNDETLSAEEAIQKAQEFLDQKEKEVQEIFDGLVEDKDYIAIVTEAVILLYPDLTDLGFISKYSVIMNFGYKSNIKAFFANELRRINENVFENIMNGANRRSLATDQIEQLKFNRNIFNISCLAHARGFFRGIVFESAKLNNQLDFKCVVSPSRLPLLNKDGITAQNVYIIKSQEEWDRTNGVTNVNVVNGLGLHHGSIEYYYSTSDVELAKKQREQFLQNI